MSKLTDLRVLHDRFDVEAVNRNTRSASVSDLVEALLAEGFLVVKPEALREILNEELAALVEALGEDAE